MTELIGVHTTAQAREARFANGVRVMKGAGEAGDGTSEGTLGTIIGSIHAPEIGTGYFVEWDNLKGMACFVVEWKLRAAS